jgi:hypothetical protein
MFQTKSGLRLIATVAAATITIIGAGLPAQAASKYAVTDAFLKAKFTNGQFIAGFTPGVADYGFTLEGILQRKALGEPRLSLAPAVSYVLENPTLSGTPSKPSGFLFDAKGNLKFGIAGKWAFTSAAVSANNSPLRKQVLKAILSKIDVTGDLAAGTNANSYDRAWSVLALSANHQQDRALALALKMASHQLADGGFNDGWTLGTGSPDGTGITLQALQSVKQFASKKQLAVLNASIAKAVAFLTGSLVSQNHYESYGDYNINGTEYAAMGLTAVGKTNSAVKTWILSKLNADGGLETPWSAGSGDTYATAQGAVAMLGESYLDLVK